MKKINFVIIPILFILLCPFVVNAQSVTYVDGGVFYYRGSLNTSDSSNSYSFNSGVLPVYPIATDSNTVPLMVHNALQFIIANPSTNKVGRSYSATIEFTYMFDGFSSNIQPDNPYLVGGLYPTQGESIITSSSNSVTVLESTATYAKVKIVYNANLNGSYQLDNFIVSLSSTGKYGLADCGTSTGEGSCRNVLVSQLSLLSVDIDISNDLNTGLLNNINTNQQITNDKLDNIESTLTDDRVHEFGFKDFDFGINFDEQERPISALLTMPLTLVNTFLNGINGTCTGYTIPFLFNETITFPCIHLEDYLGSNLWSIIDSICSIYLIYNIAMMVISFFDKLTSLENVFDSLYEPKHMGAEYKAKHARGD